MKRLWYRLLASLMPGTRMVIGLLVVGCLATSIGTLTRIYDLYSWLALSAPTFWSGQFWQIVTYVLVPASILHFLINGIAIAALGGAMERVWSSRELWIYCALVTIVAGAAKIFSQCFQFSLLVGSMPLVFGLLAAWGYVFRHEKLLLMGLGEVTSGLVAILTGVITFTVIWLSTGLSNALIMVGGALGGLVYLWVQSKIISERPSQVVHSERINRLEL